jgi:hypothetical protein
MPSLSAHIKHIGDSGAFPSEEFSEAGMTYRQYLIGFALAGGVDAKAAIAKADEAIMILAEEASESSPVPKSEKPEKVELVSISIDRI